MSSKPLIGNRVKVKRLSAGWSQAELAGKAGMSRTAISALEGSRLTPSVAAALALAKVFGCSVEALFSEGDSSSRAPEWAWAPARTPTRYRQAEVDGRTLLYPCERGSGDLHPHDGVARDGEILSQATFAAENTLVLATCDPSVNLLAVEMARTSGIRLLTLSRSSNEALRMLAAGHVHLAGVHLCESHDANGNLRIVQDRLGPEYSLMRIACWEEGIALAYSIQSSSVKSILKSKLRWVGREVGSGARQCLDQLFARRAAPRTIARNHDGVAEAIRGGWADAGVCLRLSAEEAGLTFISVRREAYDIVFKSASAGDPRVRAFLKSIRGSTYRRLMSDLPGYDVSRAGEVQTTS